MRSIITFLVCLFITNLYGQATKEDALYKLLDSLLIDYNNTTPGIGVAVVQDGKLIAKKTSGLASIEYNIPFSDSSIVRMEYAEGRQFISIAAIMMENNGLLSLKDKINKYFPKLPAWSEPVTIKDLLNHSSGFVDEWAVLLLTQSSMGNRFDESQFLHLLYTQPKPEIEPGKGYMYCNSDFGLLRLILEKASGENLSNWMRKNIFQPFAMFDTRLHDNKYEAIVNFAPIYYPLGNGKYNQWTLDKTSPGGNYFIATSLRDIIKWSAVLSDNSSIPSKALIQLKKDAQLMPGMGNNYVFGVKEKLIGDHRVIFHQGVNNRPYLSQIPSSNISIAMIGNYSYENFPLLHESIYQNLLGIETEKQVLKSFKKEPVLYTKEQLKDFEGRYFDIDTISYESFTAERKHIMRFQVQNDSLRLSLGGIESIPLEYIKKNVFKEVGYEAYMEFIQSSGSQNTWQLKTYEYPGRKIYTHIKDTSQLWQPGKQDLAEFEGKFYSTHLDFYWTLTVTDKNKLIVIRPTIAPTELYPESKDLFTMMVEKYPLVANEVFVKFHRDSSGNISHFTVYHNRLMHHRFDKTK